MGLKVIEGGSPFEVVMDARRGTVDVKKPAPPSGEGESEAGGRRAGGYPASEDGECVGGSADDTGYDPDGHDR